MAATVAPTVFIVGPTASGKSSLAVSLAQRHSGEIICADSRTIFKGMDIGTAKPSAEDQKSVPHWGLDLVEPGERFTAADFKKYAQKKIAEIRDRGNIPFVVGGTGLYVDGLLFDYQFGQTDLERRSDLEAKSLEELLEIAALNNTTLPENSSNKRYVIRAIEQQGVNTKRQLTPIGNSIVVGISTEKDVLRKRIELRNEQLFQDGVVEEANTLGKKYGWNSEAMTGNIYRIIRQFLDNELTIDEAKERASYADWHLAKRQLTWMKRNEYIQWKSLEQAEQYLDERLA